MEKLIELYDKVAGWLASIAVDKHLHIEVGMMIAAFCYIVLHLRWCIVAVIACGVLKECIDRARGGKFDLRDLLATTIGGAVVQLFALLA